MNKKIALLFLITLGFFSNCSLSKKEKSVEVVDCKKRVSSDVLKLLELTGVQHDGTLDDTVKQTQDQWLRKPGQERWDIEKYTIQNEQELWTVFSKLGLCDAAKPQYQEYEHALILGALFKRIADRMQYLVDLWKQGTRFKSIVMLGGARPVVEAQGENLESYLAWLGQESLDQNLPETETDVLKFVYDHIDMPEEMKALPVVFVDVPMLQNSSGSLRRPTTGDTIEWWLKTDPTPGRCLFVSSQPYVGYQQSVVKTFLPSNFMVDTVGSKCSGTLNIGVMLDNLARWLYQENKRLQKVKA